MGPSGFLHCDAEVKIRLRSWRLVICNGRGGSVVPSISVLLVSVLSLAPVPWSWKEIPPYPLFLLARPSRHPWWSGAWLCDWRGAVGIFFPPPFGLLAVNPFSRGGLAVSSCWSLFMSFWLAFSVVFVVICSRVWCVSWFSCFFSLFLVSLDPRFA